MKIKTAEFVGSAPDFESCPPSELGEIAMIGRSNVGKSSLINMLAERNGLARVSRTPGRTQLINFFLMNGEWTLVDLPGYGFAKRSREQTDKFNEFVSDYLAQRKNLLCAFILIDSKIPPQKVDIEFTTWVVQTGIPFALIFTKTDKAKDKGMAKNVEAFKAELAKHCDGEPKTFMCSAKTRRGRGGIMEFVRQSLVARKSAS